MHNYSQFSDSDFTVPIIPRIAGREAIFLAGEIYRNCWNGDREFRGCLTSPEEEDDKSIPRSRNHLELKRSLSLFSVSFSFSFLPKSSLFFIRHSFVHNQREENSRYRAIIILTCRESGNFAGDTDGLLTTQPRVILPSG